ncbi:MAG: hypothetical protein ACWA41_04670 [Putridiphycobacter sp.]
MTISPFTLLVNTRKKHKYILNKSIATVRNKLVDLISDDTNSIIDNEFFGKVNLNTFNLIRKQKIGFWRKSKQHSYQLKGNFIPTPNNQTQLTLIFDDVYLRIGSWISQLFFTFALISSYKDLYFFLAVFIFYLVIDLMLSLLRVAHAKSGVTDFEDRMENW